jgi:hypothetical protein
LAAPRWKYPKWLTSVALASIKGSPPPAADEEEEADESDFSTSKAVIFID